MPDNLVYRMEEECLLSPAWRVGGAEALFIAGPLLFMRHAPALLRLLGIKAAGWYLLQILRRRRFLCAFSADNRIVSHVWATQVGWHYPIEHDACVFGPLRTQPDMQRRGLATAVLQNAIAFLQLRGYRIFYIHTATTNTASQKTIARAGFGGPFAILRDGKLCRRPPESGS
jgi:GNAT superfamily N-acetyltransferase